LFIHSFIVQNADDKKMKTS